ncbi:SURF1 family protein [Microbacterium sp. P03]|uniref:SURF1 family cytochrome oxidase biogenesis protein n=1 Tax=Microbacterium sp. P03 TaxID=3366946 RepID=UPI00374713B8
MSRRTATPAMRWTLYIAIAIVFAIACAFLSQWQFSRNSWRSEQLTLIAQNYDADPVAVSDVLTDDGALVPGTEWQPVLLRGQYLSEQQLLVRNRPHGGTAAYEVLVPFATDDGRVLMIDRGWVPPGDQHADPDTVPAAPAGEVEVIARVRPGEDLPRSGRTTAPDGQVPTINLPVIAGLLDPVLPAPVEQGAYGIMVSEDPAAAVTPTPLESPSDDPGPYLSYAVQWILFAVMGFIFIWYVIRSERRHRREEAEEQILAAQARAEGREPEPPASVTRERDRARRRDRDAADEDALADSHR